MLVNTESVRTDARPFQTLLLASATTLGRSRLQRALTEAGFGVACANSAAAALALAVQNGFTYAIIDRELERERWPKGGHGLVLVRKLRQSHASMRIIVVTDHDSFASVVLALRAGADDLLPKSMSESELVGVLLSRSRDLPPVPDTPLCAQRQRWEHIHRIFEQCGRNIAETSRRLGMHRRTLHRILAKRAPRPRGPGSALLHAQPDERMTRPGT
jgi:two-component system, response regulator RegA